MCKGYPGPLKTIRKLLWKFCPIPQHLPMSLFPICVQLVMQWFSLSLLNGRLPYLKPGQSNKDDFQFVDSYYLNSDPGRKYLKNVTLNL